MRQESSSIAALSCWYKNYLDLGWNFLRLLENTRWLSYSAIMRPPILKDALEYSFWNSSWKDNTQNSQDRWPRKIFIYLRISSSFLYRFLPFPFPCFKYIVYISHYLIFFIHFYFSFYSCQSAEKAPQKILSSFQWLFLNVSVGDGAEK